MTDDPITLSYDRGTVVLASGPAGFNYNALPGVLFDPRTSTHRAQGRFYRGIVEQLIREKLPYTDNARGWPIEPTGWVMTSSRVPREYQKQAAAAWLKSRRGVVVMPTGTGKTFTAFLCMEKIGRPTLIVTPTIDLMNQWFAELTDVFGVEVGLVGGGYYDFKPLTVTTYDSAYINLERWGNKYGMLVFDECHHLPGPSYAEAANAGLAPFRLGLTATPERADGGDGLLPDLIGPIVYRLDINDAGDFLAPYEARKVFIDLTPQEMERYQACREEYRGFILDHNISMSGPNGWQKFIFEASRSPEGWKAMAAYREYKHIECAQASGKFNKLEELLHQHAGERTLIFTADNATVYEIARRYLVPAITHQTKIKERKGVLEKFHSGEYTVVVTSQVLNEGVDVPAAGIGIVLSGSGSTRENVQRLGRILRKFEDKQAILYELIAKGTAEEFVSDRRRQHRAFQ